MTTVHSKSGGLTNDDLEKQQDPAQRLVYSLVDTNDKLMRLQGSVATTEEFWAVGASNSVHEGDLLIQKAALAVKQASDQSVITQASANLQVVQTEVSTTNQNYNTVVTGGATIMNAGTQVMSQELQIGSVAITQKAEVNNLLAGWGN